MRLIENLVDRLMEVRLFEMAFQRKNIIEQCKNLQTQIAIRVVKCSIWPENEARRYWESEIDILLDTIRDMTFDGNKKLPSHTYFNLLWAGPFENTSMIERWAKSPNTSTRLPQVKLSPGEQVELENKIWLAYAVICDELSSNEIALSPIESIFSRFKI